MFRDRFFLLPLVAVFFVLGACQSEGKLTGEVFIVTEGRENIEMGLVDVKAIRADSVKNYLQGRYGRAQQEVKARASEVETLLDSLAKLSKNSLLVPSYEAYTLDTPQGSADVGDRVVAMPIGEIDLGRDRKLTSNTTGILISKLEYGFYEINFGEYKGQVKRDRIISISDYNEIKERRKGVEEKKEKIKEIEKSFGNIFRRIERCVSRSYYYRDMPSPSSSSETGSDGNYELTVEGGVPYYLVARASRSVGDEEEQYYWMVKTTVGGGEVKEVNLSNDNLGGVVNKGYALNERTLSTVRRIWESSIGLAKEGEELEWEKLIYRTAFPDDTTGVPIPDDLDVPEDELLSDR
ncbi:hypothetical protein [Salinibacter ruber]|uniref:hypothetical protein n=1 Tax=Salinibacter ruber TaxID=146919 RepID=UPI0013E8CB1C|nr:hypothetical protein [Salinibacter ruber]MCS4101481.1 hypothetical protein [Salinibacter ruber]